jgi:hypothetical protein
MPCDWVRGSRLYETKLEATGTCYTVTQYNIPEEMKPQLQGCENIKTQTLSPARDCHI